MHSARVLERWRGERSRVVVVVVVRMYRRQVRKGWVGDSRLEKRVKAAVSHPHYKAAWYGTREPIDGGYPQDRPVTMSSR